MDLVAFTCHRSFVLDAPRQGEIDYLEHVSEAAVGQPACAGHVRHRENRPPPCPFRGQRAPARADP
jgi:hypothetical protein